MAARIHSDDEPNTSGEEVGDEDEVVTALRDISCTVPRGALAVVVGATGAGKSTFLSGLLGESKILNGSIHMPTETKISLVTQKAWIQEASLRDNILFGSEYDEQRYKQVRLFDLVAFTLSSLFLQGSVRVRSRGGPQAVS
jgi:ABC-type transport system involved in cytochrome bd biosynthesis fused ATPase/permease subunit